MLTLEAFEQATEVVKKVAIETKLTYSEYLSEQCGNKVYQSCLSNYLLFAKEPSKC